MQVTQIVEGDIEAEEVREDFHKLREGRLPNLIHTETNVYHVCQRFGGTQANFIDHIAIKVQLLQRWRQELYLRYTVERQVDPFEILKFGQGLVNRNNFLLFQV